MGRVLYERNKGCKKCGCKYATQQHEKDETKTGDHITKTYISCANCGDRELKQKTRTYKIGDGLKQVVLDKEQLNGLKALTRSKAPDNHEHKQVG